METTAPVAVENIKIGDLIDLTSCPFLKNHPSADLQYAEVAHVERDANNCVAIGYEGIDHVGYAIGTLLWVKQIKDVPDPVVKVRPVATTPSKFIDWRVSQNLTDRWGEINNHNEANKPLELLVGTPGLLDRLREQMWDEICFVVRRDGQFGILFEVEYVSYESDSADHDPEFTEELKPICEMMKIIADAAMKKLVPKFPGVEFVIPDEDEIVNGRPALWAWVPDGLLTAEQREDLGTLMLNL